jgi:hypothetical protein
MYFYKLLGNLINKTNNNLNQMLIHQSHLYYLKENNKLNKICLIMLVLIIKIDNLSVYILNILNNLLKKIFTQTNRI